MAGRLRHALPPTADFTELPRDPLLLVRPGRQRLHSPAQARSGRDHRGQADAGDNGPRQLAGGLPAGGYAVGSWPIVPLPSGRCDRDWAVS